MAHRERYACCGIHHAVQIKEAKRANRARIVRDAWVKAIDHSPQPSLPDDPYCPSCNARHPLPDQPGV